ncbi:MAG: hypothetical protein ACREMX_13055 [Gemmatimonadales bacterium]
MTGSEAGNGPDRRERLDYFMVRLARREREPDRLAGLVERLATGEKRAFASADQLVRLVSEWDASGSNMESAGE